MPASLHAHTNVVVTTGVTDTSVMRRISSVPVRTIFRTKSTWYFGCLWHSSLNQCKCVCVQILEMVENICSPGFIGSPKGSASLTMWAQLILSFIILCIHGPGKYIHKQNAWSLLHSLLHLAIFDSSPHSIMVASTRIIVYQECISSLPTSSQVGLWTTLICG